MLVVNREKLSDHLDRPIADDPTQRVGQFPLIVANTGASRVGNGWPPGTSSAVRYARGLRYRGQSDHRRPGHGRMRAVPTRAPSAANHAMSSGSDTPAIVNAIAAVARLHEQHAHVRTERRPRRATRAAAATPCPQRPRARTGRRSRRAPRGSPENGATAGDSVRPRGTLGAPRRRRTTAATSTPIPIAESTATVAATATCARDDTDALLRELGLGRVVRAVQAERLGHAIGHVVRLRARRERARAHVGAELRDRHRRVALELRVRARTNFGRR